MNKNQEYATNLFQWLPRSSLLQLAQTSLRKQTMDWQQALSSIYGKAPRIAQDITIREIIDIVLSTNRLS